MKYSELSAFAERLRGEFYASLDMSMIYSKLEALSSLELLGAGAHFRSYRLRVHGFDFCVSLAKDCFYAGDSQGLRAWARGMSRLGAVQHPLVPPIYTGAFNGRPMYLSPYCPETLPKIGEGIEEGLLELEGLLRRERLYLDDYIQLRAIGGHPFVIDWSDLKIISRL